MRLKNYTNIKHREKRIYSIMNTQVSRTGILTSYIWTSLLLLIPFTIGGVIFQKYTGYGWYNPVHLLDNTKATLWFYMIVVGLPIFLGVFLNKQKVQNIRLINYIQMVFTRKRPIRSNGEVIKQEGYSINCFVEKIN